MICLKSNNLADFEELEATICYNLGISNDYGTTGFLDIRTSAEGFYYTIKPTFWAGNMNEGYTQEQILDGADLSKFSEVEYDDVWGNNDRFNRRGADAWQGRGKG